MTVESLHYNSDLDPEGGSPGKNRTTVGFVGSGSADPVPDQFTLNELPCATG